METCEIRGFTRTEEDGWVFFEDHRKEEDYPIRLGQAFTHYQELQSRRVKIRIR